MHKILSIGKYSSLVAAVAGALYGLLQIFFGLHILPHPENLYWFFAPSLLLAVVFLVTTVCLDIVVPQRVRPWTISAWALATINCTVIFMIFCYQPGIMNPAHFDPETGDMGLNLFQLHTTLMAVKYAGFFLTGTSTFLLAFAFRNRQSTWLFRSLLLNVILLPLLMVCRFYPNFFLLTSAFTITFPLATFHLSKYFAAQEKKLQKKENKILKPLNWVID
ncbi:MAG: hypothetical protein ACTHNG_06080 [Ginsengibacter sp.]